MKLQFCCGANILPGWENHDADVDISKTMPFPSGCASHVFCEHGIEHITHRQAWNFLAECHRILQSGGWIRIAIPDFDRVWSAIKDNTAGDYIRIASKDGTARGALRAMVFDHGHQSLWNGNLLYGMMDTVGFERLSFEQHNTSACPEMRGIDGHGKAVGEAIAALETTAVEGRKL